jgi:hypothetical protein
VMQHSARAGVFSSVMRRSHIGLLLILIAGALSAVPTAQNPQRTGEGARPVC